MMAMGKLYKRSEVWKKEGQSVLNLDSKGCFIGKKTESKELLGVRDGSPSKTSTSRTATTSAPRDVSSIGKIWIQLAEVAEKELLGVSVIEQLPGLPAMSPGLVRFGTNWQGDAWSSGWINFEEFENSFEDRIQD
ncbi:hypothetical protein L5515_003741 [Caenorhabditis briggsae]|uniref:Uncharacterized protein n=1 Tax=Caenorhabditis briggsae TaxID=6238 RepID=A0AAE9EK58_CAEBR|nr:hypothetical protein L5515_003741 [Caenorhabditis briggsae]